jgi:pimeloyl-ACP methyl ester carboxylesterase
MADQRRYGSEREKSRGSPDATLGDEGERVRQSTAVKAIVGAAGAIAAATAWELQRRVDVRRLEADPEHDFLMTRLDGRPSRLTSHDGTVLHVEAYGPEDAPTVVLVHGWTCTGQFWKNQVRDLSRELRVITYDQRGHGRSDPAVGDDYGIDAFADDLEAVLQAHVPAGERAVVAGHSLGGMTIVAWAGRHASVVTDRVGAAALVNTGMGDLITQSLVVHTPAGLDTLKRTVGRVVLSAKAPLPKGPTPLSTRAVHYVALGPQASPAAVAFTEQLVLECPRAARAGVGTMLSRLDLYESIGCLRVPTVVIAGERDRLSPPGHSRRLAETLPELAELVEVPGSGHMSPLEMPDEVTSRIRDLARRHL